MSKSVGKYKSLGFCTGSNTPYYKERRKFIRNKNRHLLRNVVANSKMEDIDDEFIPIKLPKRDDWREPTDGTFKYNAKEINKLKQSCGKSFGLYTTKTGKVKK